MLKTAWTLLRQTVSEYLDDQALSRGAAIAFYTVTSLAPVLVIVIAIAGLAFGHEAAQGAIVHELRGLMGQQSADLLQSAVKSAAGKSAGIIATVVGGLTLLATASGVFGEMQSALNVIWKAKPKGTTVSKLVRARVASLGLVMTLGFLLLVSLVASAGLSALKDFIDYYIPFGKWILVAINFAISFTLISFLFAAIYKALPDKHMEWRDVAVGAIATSALFTIGKTIIGLYLGSSSVASSYGAASGLIIALLWVYYSAQIFLLGAEFTKVYAVRFGSHQGSDIKDPQHYTEQAPDTWQQPDTGQGPLSGQSRPASASASEKPRAAMRPVPPRRGSALFDLTIGLGALALLVQSFRRLRGNPS